ncbi:MAG: ABC transporter substrate-binding protein, partial [Phycisphaerae bacterium]|nr:ABC transporter substrate-binding protein [Phycisphaerae bacterium]
MLKKGIIKGLMIISILLMIGFPLAAGGQEDTATESEPITIKYTIVGGTSPDIPLVEEALNEMIHERLDPNYNIDLDILDWGEYQQALSLRFSAGESMDIVFTPKWWGLFYGNQSMGNLAPLDDYIKGEFPNFEDQIAVMLPGTSIDGKVYGLPGIQQVVSSAGLGIRVDLLEKYPLDWDTINTFEDAEEYLLNIIEKEPEIEFAMPPTESFRPGYYGYDNITAGIEGGVFTNGLFGVMYDDETLQVENLLKSAAFKDYCERIDRWHDLKIVSDYQDDNAFANFRTKYALYLHYQQPHGWWDPSYPYFGKALAPPFVGNFRVGENTTSISATSDHPEEAYRLYAFINSDVEVFNTIVYGVEGVYWEWE